MVVYLLDLPPCFLYNNIYDREKGESKMLKYTELFHKLIGMRIKNYRKIYKVKQGDIEIDSSAISKIENGRVDPKKNPNFICGGHMVQILNIIPVSPTELIWGQKEDKELFLKLITLAILLNDGITDKHDNDISPFYNIPFETWIRKEWEYAPTIIEQTLQNLEEAQDKYGFFINEKTYDLYSLLKPEFSKEYEALSNLMLQTLNHDYEYSKLFYRHLINYTNNTSDADNKMELLLENLVLHKGTYAPFILDKNGVDYPVFIYAFNKFWDKVKESYLDYFEQQICSYGDSYLLSNGLKHFNNDFFQHIFTSPDFIYLNQRISIFSEYLDSEAALSSLNMRLEIISAIHENKSDQTRNEKLLDIIYPTKALINYLKEHPTKDLINYLKENL